VRENNEFQTALEYESKGETLTQGQLRHHPPSNNLMHHSISTWSGIRLKSPLTKALKKGKWATIIKLTSKLKGFQRLEETVARCRGKKDFLAEPKKVRIKAGGYRLHRKKKVGLRKAIEKKQKATAGNSKGGFTAGKGREWEVREKKGMDHKREPERGGLN